MEIHSQRFVKKSDLFADLNTLSEIFNESDHPHITWGGANRTMIDGPYFEQWASADMEIIAEEGAEAQWEILEARIKALPDGVLVDLEN